MLGWQMADAKWEKNKQHKKMKRQSDQLGIKKIVFSISLSFFGSNYFRRQLARMALSAVTAAVLLLVFVVRSIVFRDFVIVVVS